MPGYMVAHRIRKARTRRGKQALIQRAPKLHENTKSILLVKGGNVSSVISESLLDFLKLTKPISTMMKRRNPFHPFENDAGLESFAAKYDASLFAFGNHSKKRPHNLAIGRMFDYHSLDMVEFGITNYKSLKSFHGPKAAIGSKPCLLFAGEQFQTDPTLARIKNLLIDFFRGEEVTHLRLQGLEHVITFTYYNSAILMRTYKIDLLKSGTRVPRVELTEMGPNMDLTLRRTKIASDDLFKTAMKKPKQLKIGKVKNVSEDVFGTKLARVHLGKQGLDALQTRKMKGLKKKRTPETPEKPLQDE